MPCLRRATSLAYTDADEDAERLLSFDADSGKGDEWVETHAGRPSHLDSAANPGTIDDIPDLDGAQDEELASAAGKINIAGGADDTPDLDDIPDMEEDLEEEDDAAAAPSKPAVAPAAAEGLEKRWVRRLLHTPDRPLIA